MTVPRSIPSVPQIPSIPHALLRGLPTFRMQFPGGLPGVHPEHRGISTFWFQCLKEVWGNCMRDCGGVESWEC